jgi:hypothetical protein
MSSKWASMDSDENNAADERVRENTCVVLPSTRECACACACACALAHTHTHTRTHSHTHAHTHTHTHTHTLFMNSRSSTSTLSFAAICLGVSSSFVSVYQYVGVDTYLGENMEANRGDNESVKGSEKEANKVDQGDENQ